MRWFTHLREACAVNAAMLGAAFISGREAASFFAGTGWASWIGIGISALIFGTMMGMLCHFARRTGTDSLPGIYYALLDERCGDAVSIVHGLLMLMMGAVAVSTAGELGMLSLNLHNPAPAAALAAMALAMALTLRGMRPLSALAILFIPVCIIFFVALALDNRPSAAGVYIENSLQDMRGSVPAAVFLGAMFAFLKAAMAGSIAVTRSRGLRPAAFALACGGILAVTVSTANWALQKAGSHVWALNLPGVVLAARWGTAGYYISIAVMYAGSVFVLACALGSLMTLFSARISRTSALFMTAAAVTMMSATGLKPLVSLGYPMLGWLCAICLCALAVFYERKPRGKTEFLHI